MSALRATPRSPKLDFLLRKIRAVVRHCHQTLVPVRAGHAAQSARPSVECSATTRRWRTSPASFVAIVLLVALFLRIAAARGELWLDEIWSLELATNVQSPLDIFTRLRHDNNHMLNTAYLWLVGAGRPWIVYRLPAVFAGTLSVILGGIVAARAGQVASLTAMTLLGTSYLMVHYSSEARGYAWAMLFVLAGLESLLRYAARPRWTWAMSFGTCCCLGFLSHPLFIHFWLASVYWSVCAQWREKVDWTRTLRQTMACHAVPLMLAVVLWKTQWSALELGGGPKYSLLAKLVEAGSVACGGPVSGIGALIAAGIFSAAVISGVRCFKYCRLGTLVATAVVMPILQAVVARPPFLFLRYFVVAFLLGILAVAVWLSWLYRRGRWGRAVYAVLLAAFIAANTWHTIQLVRTGRGQYVAAMSFMAAATTEDFVTISSDHNFGIGKLVDFYGPLARPARRWQYIGGQQWPPEGPQWLVLHREAASTATPLETRLLIDGHEFQLQRLFDCAKFSGWQWACYRQL